MADTEVAEEISAYELLRLRNIKENIQKMKELGLIDDTTVPHFGQSTSKGTGTKKRQSFKSNGKKPPMFMKKRRSQRLAAGNMGFSSEVLKIIVGDDNIGSTLMVNVDEYEESDGVENTCIMSWVRDDQDSEDNDDSSDSENAIKPRSRIKTERTNRQVLREILPVDEITTEHLDNVAKTVRDKVYSQHGTTCHQCRQKTEDQKTICRSKECYGVRGQFCGPCLKNRYGESVVEALKDPEWNCPVCRGKCNCSICRTQAGKLPTGQMVNFAQQQGFDSVIHLLEQEEAE